MKLNFEFLNTFSLTQQLTVGKAHERYCSLTSKNDKSQAEIEEMACLEGELKPYSVERLDAVESPPHQQPVKNRPNSSGIVLNVQKVAAARLSGARELALYRDSVALGRLLSKPVHALSVGEAAQLSALKSRLIGFVGPLGRAGRETDLKVAA